MQLDADLRRAVEDLYEDFSAYKLRRDTQACPCCHTTYDEERLHKLPLRELKADDLRQFAYDALLVWGSEDDFKHFLPRLFELEAEYGADFVDPEILLSKLRHGEWRYWPNPEQRAIERFLRVLWFSVINRDPDDLSGIEIESWLCGIAQAESRLAPFLESWVDSRRENPRLNLAAFIADTDFADPNSKAEAFWGERYELFNEVKDWVRSDAVRAEIKELTLTYPQIEFVERAYLMLS
jgi:hypothetical protein